MCSVTIMRPYKLELKQRGGSLEDEVQVTLFEYTLSKKMSKTKKIKCIHDPSANRFFCLA